jgi:acyl carrier protein
MEKKILEILSGIRPEFDFTTSEHFLRDGLLDSFDMITLVDDLEKTFRVKIAGTDILPDNFKSVAAIRDTLARYGAKE